LKIILSYRRSDSAGIAGRIFDRFVGHFGSESVFMDIDNIPFGIDFREHIKAELGNSNVVLVIIGLRWLNDGGARRIDNENDLVRIEIETALGRGIPVIPILVDGATMPLLEELPNSLRDLVFRNAAPVDPGRDFHVHIDRLIRSIDRLVQRPGSPQRANGQTMVAPEAVTARDNSAPNAVRFAGKGEERLATEEAGPLARETARWREPEEERRKAADVAQQREIADERLAEEERRRNTAEVERQRRERDAAAEREAEERRKIGEDERRRTEEERRHQEAQDPLPAEQEVRGKAATEAKLRADQEEREKRAEDAHQRTDDDRRGQEAEAQGFSGPSVAVSSVSARPAAAPCTPPTAPQESIIAQGLVANGHEADNNISRWHRSRHLFLIGAGVFPIAIVTLVWVSMSPGVIQQPTATNPQNSKIYFKTPLEKDALRIVELATANVPPHASSEFHTHPGEEWQSVQEGEVTFTVKGQPPRILRAGESVYVARGTVHRIQNLTDKPARTIETRIVDKDKPGLALKE
jgi:quercetin dioxygenase-like cupin family protein/flagellar biosynthesis GTPase FlhF